MAGPGPADETAPEQFNMVTVATHPEHCAPDTLNVPRSPQVPISTSPRIDETTTDVLSSLPPPPPFDLRVVNLTVGAPPSSQYLPLPIPIPIPKFLLKNANEIDSRPKTILQNVDAECQSGEMLAMYV